MRPAATTKKGAQARGGQVDEIVETRRRPAEGFVTRRFVADHAVGGIGRLVADATRKTEYPHPEGRRHDAVREILRQALDRRAADGGFIELFRVAPDDFRDGLAPGFEPSVSQRRRDGLDMAFKAFLRRQGRGDQNQQDRPKRDDHKVVFDHQAEQGCDAEERQKGEHALSFPLGKAVAFPVQVAVQPGYQCANPGDGMADAPEQPVRITEDALHDQGRKCEKEHEVGRP